MCPGGHVEIGMRNRKIRVTGEDFGDFGSALLLKGDRNHKLQRVASTGQEVIQIFPANEVHQWLDLPSLGSLFCSSKAIATLIRDTPKKVAYDMTKLNALRHLLCNKCFEQGCLIEAYINDFLRHCKTRKICYEKLGFQVSFQEHFEFVPSYLKVVLIHAVSSSSITIFQRHIHTWNGEEKFYKHQFPYF